MYSRRKLWTIRVLAVLATAALTAFAAYAYAGIKDVGDPHCERAPKQLAADGGGKDYEWARDVVDCDRFDGLTKQEVQVRLGSPDDRHEGDPRGDGDGTTWYFPAGTSGGSDQGLVIEFDSTGKAIDSSTIELSSGAYD